MDELVIAASTQAILDWFAIEAKTTIEAKYPSHPGLVDIRAARNFSRFAPPPGAAHFSIFARATDP